MFTKETPRWVTVGALALATIAGCVNAAGLLGLHRQPVTHMTGTVTALGVELARGDRALAWHTFLVLLFFFLGCVLSGVIVRHSALKVSRRYSAALFGEALLLFAATVLFRGQHDAGYYLAAMAAGLQNAMATSYSGAVVRTTHMTGIVTDLGIAVGLLARREPVDWRRVRLYLVLLGGFTLGGIAGAAGFLRLGPDILLVPATAAALAGFIQLLLRRRLQRTGGA